MSRIPSTKLPLFKRIDWIAEAIVAFMAFSTAIGAGVKAELDRQNTIEYAQSADRPYPSRIGPNLVWVTAIAIFGSGFIRVYSSREKSKAMAKNESPQDLYGCCLMLRHRFVGLCGEDGDPRSFRLTLYRVTARHKKRPQDLERVIPYVVGNGADPGETGLVVSARCGVIGMAARTGDVARCHRTGGTEKEFRQEMITTYSFSEQEARQLDETRWSWLAIPIRDAQSRVDGVLYLDSSKKDCFSDDVCSQVVAACEGLRDFIDRRYGNGRN